MAFMGIKYGKDGAKEDKDAKMSQIELVDETLTAKID